MGHHSCCNKQKVRRGLWSPEEDEKLVKYVTSHGHGCWSSVPKQAGLQRCGKSCRLRWINYLRPDLKRGCFSIQEERLIIELHRILGNRWAQIAKHLPGRTDNEVKNFWNSCIKKKLLAQGMDLNTHQLINQPGSITESQSTEKSLNGQGIVNAMGGHVSGSNDLVLMNADLREIASGSGLPPPENVDISSYALLPDMICKGWPYEYQISIAHNNTSFERKFIQAELTSVPSMPASSIKDFLRLESKQLAAQYNLTGLGHHGIDTTIPIYEMAMTHQLVTPTVAQNDCGLYSCCPTQLPKLCEMEHAEDQCNSNIKGENDIQFSVSTNCESYEHFDIDLFDSSVMVSECMNHPVAEWS